MTFTLISNNSVTPVTMDGGDDFLMLTDASIVVTDDEALSITGNPQTALLLGTIYADANGSADMRILLGSVGALIEDDLIL